MSTAFEQGQGPIDPLEGILANVHTAHDLYQATVDKSQTPGHEFDESSLAGIWATIGVGTGNDRPQIGYIQNGVVTSVRQGKLMPGKAVLAKYAAHHGLGDAAAAVEQLARIRVRAAGTYIEHDNTPDGPRVVAFGIKGTEKIAPKTEQSLQALQDAGFVSASTILGPNPRIPGMLSENEILLRNDFALGAPDSGAPLDISARDVNQDVTRFLDWYDSVDYWTRRAEEAAARDLPPTLGGAAVAGSE